MENELLRDFLRFAGRRWGQAWNIWQYIGTGRNILFQQCVIFSMYHEAGIMILLNA
jgi:hypothetical protein